MKTHGTHRRRPTATWMLMVLAFGLGGLGSCRSCRDRGPAHVLELVAADAYVVLHVPDLEALRHGAEGFFSRATRKSAVLAGTFRKKLAKQLGFDPLGIEDWAQIGLRPQLGAALFSEGHEDAALLALGVSNRKQFDAALQQLVRQVDGANQQTQENLAGRTVLTIGRPFGDQTVPVLHWSHIGRFALLARAADRAALTAALNRLGALAPVAATGGETPTTPSAAAASLHGNAAFTAQRQKVQQGTALLRVRGVSDGGTSPGHALPGDAVASFSLGADGLRSEAHLAVPGIEFGPVFAGPPPLPLAGSVADDAVLVGLTHAANPSALKALRAVPSIGKALASSSQRLRRDTGIDPEKDALPHLAGPLTVSLHLHDVAKLPAQLRARSLHGFLDVIHFAMTAKLSDPVKMLETLKRSQTALGQRNVTIRSQVLSVGEREATFFEPDVVAPRLGWGIVGETYVYTAGSGRLKRTLELVGSQKSTLPAKLQNSVAKANANTKNTAVVVARLGTVADALAQARLGGGLAGLIGSALDLLRTLGDVTVAVRAQGGGLRLELREDLQ